MGFDMFQSCIPMYCECQCVEGGWSLSFLFLVSMVALPSSPRDLHIIVAS